MLQIKCEHCGQTLKGKDIKIEPFYCYIDGARYQDYAVKCTKCGGSIVWDRYVQKAAENKTKALTKLAKKSGKSVAQISEESQYTAIMRKVGKRARELASLHPSNPLVRITDFDQAIAELPQDEREIMLAYEDKKDMELLQSKTNKPSKHIKPNAILLMTQSIIESAIADNDEDFFKSEYGAQVVDTYNTVLTMHKHYDYEITAELLLEKMRKNEIKSKGEQDDE